MLCLFLSLILSYLARLARYVFRFPFVPSLFTFIYSFSFSDWVILRASLFSFLQRPLAPQSHVISFFPLVYTYVAISASILRHSFPSVFK